MVSSSRSLFRSFWTLVLLALLAVSSIGAGQAQAPGVEPQAELAPPLDHLDINGPEGSGRFGNEVLLLPNGNLVVTDPEYDNGSLENAGAVYLLDGVTGAIINWAYGSHAEDRVGSDIYALETGNYVIASSEWDNGSTENAGAATWCSGATGCSGAISGTNSLVGSHSGDRVGGAIYPFADGDYIVRSAYWNGSRGAATWCAGSSGCSGEVTVSNSLVGGTAGDEIGYAVWELINGNYVVSSHRWDAPGAADAGAVTWCAGTGGCTGQVSALNSLVGSTLEDYIGLVTPMANGNYLVHSGSWDDGVNANVGAVTWCSGLTGCTGAVSSSNSLVGSTAGDQLGGLGAQVLVLSSGHYLAASPYWDRGAIVDAGAVTWCDGTTGCTGFPTASNSLVGSKTNDQVGSQITLMSNGSYVVGSMHWDNGDIVDAGAVTWCHGYFGCQGAVSASNSLVGGSDNDWLGFHQVVELSNGRYVVPSPNWDRGAVVDAGAATLCNGPIACLGSPGADISLVGAQANDQVGYQVTALTNDHYVVESPYWDNGSILDAGAATWCSGASGCTGEVSAANSRVGSTDEDWVGTITALKNGNYIVSSTSWDRGSTVNAGAASWCDGALGCSGVITSANSLVGSQSGDRVGSRILPLTNGNYVVTSMHWNGGLYLRVGAATFCSGSSGCSGEVSTANSLTGSLENDRVGSELTVELKNGNYLVISQYWDNDLATDAGAITWCSGTQGCSGEVNPLNSLVGSQSNDSLGYVPGGGEPITLLDNGDYLVFSPRWQYYSEMEAGAVSLGNGFRGMTRYNGPVTTDNSVLGMHVNGGRYLVRVYDKARHQLIVGRPYDNIVTLFKGPFFELYLPIVRGQ